MTATLTFTETETGLDIQVTFPADADREATPIKLALAALEHVRGIDGVKVTDEYEYVSPGEPSFDPSLN